MIDDDLVDYIVALIDADPEARADPGRRLPARRRWRWSSSPAPAR